MSAKTDLKYIIPARGEEMTPAAARVLLFKTYGVLMEVDDDVALMRQQAKQEYVDAGYKGCGYSERLVRGGKLMFYYGGKRNNGWRFITR